MTDSLASTAGQPSPARAQKSIRSSFGNGIFAASVLWALVVILGIILYVGWNPSKLGLCIAIVFAAGSVGALGGFSWSAGYLTGLECLQTRPGVLFVLVFVKLSGQRIGRSDGYHTVVLGQSDAACRR